MRRVRAVRAGLPEPLADDDAAPADRAAPRAGAPGARVAGRRGAGAGIRARRDRHLRRRLLVRDCLPAGDRHRGAGQGPAQRTPRRARRPVAPRRRRRLGDRRVGCPRSRCARPSARRPRHRADQRAALRRVAGAERVPAWPAPCPGLAPGRCRPPSATVRTPSTCRRVSTGSSVPRGGSLPEALVAVSARAGRPVWIPADAPGHCCATPFTSKGYERAADSMAARTIDALHRWTDGGLLPLIIDATRARPGCASTSPAAPSSLSTRWSGAATGYCRRCHRRAAWPASRFTRRARCASSISSTRSSRSRARWQTRSSRQPARLLRLCRRPRAAAPRARRRRPRATKPPRSPPAPTTPTSLPTGPASSACRRPPGGPTARSCSWSRS